MVRTRLIAAPLWDGLCPLHHERAAQVADAAGRFCFDGVLAFGIVGA